MNKHVLVYVLIIAAVLLVLGGGAVVVRKLTKSEETRRDQLQPSARAALERLLARCEARGVECFVGSTGRSTEQQLANIEAGLSDTKDSWHLLGLAVHVVPLVDGEPDVKVAREDLLRIVHEEAAAVGFHQIAYVDLKTWKKKYLKSGAWDANHFEWRQGRTYAQAKAALAAKGPA